MVLLLQLLIAHLLGDFFLQTKALVDQKEELKWRSGFLYIHVLIHFGLMMIITADLSFWKYAAAITLLHLLTDLAKLTFQKETNRRSWFVIDQLIHLTVIAAVWAVHENQVFDWSLLVNQKVLTLVFAFLFIWRPSSLIIKVLISRWTPRPRTDMIRTEVESLENAGQLIGVLERLLIVVFILLDRWEGVGFLLGAKSIFRFGDLTQAKDTKLTEYVLIGTLLSFTLAIGVGLIARM